jgi:hypothetical protein
MSVKSMLSDDGSIFFVYHDDVMHAQAHLGDRCFYRERERKCIFSHSIGLIGSFLHVLRTNRHNVPYLKIVKIIRCTDFSSPQSVDI